jgi:hypothetical protein
MIAASHTFIAAMAALTTDTADAVRSLPPAYHAEHPMLTSPRSALA